MKKKYKVNCIVEMDFDEPDISPDFLEDALWDIPFVTNVSDTQISEIIPEDEIMAWEDYERLEDIKNI